MPRITYIGPGSTAAADEYPRRVKTRVRTRVRRSVKYGRPDADGGNSGDESDDDDLRRGASHDDLRRGASHDGNGDDEEGGRSSRRSRREHTALEAGVGALAAGALGFAAGEYYASHHHGGGNSSHGGSQRHGSSHHGHGHGHSHGHGGSGRSEDYGYDPHGYQYPQTEAYPGYPGPYGAAPGLLPALYAGGGLASRAAEHFQPGDTYGTNSRYVPGVGFLPDMGGLESSVDGYPMHGPPHHDPNFDGEDFENMGYGEPEYGDPRYAHHGFDPRHPPHQGWAPRGRNLGHRYPDVLDPAYHGFDPRGGAHPGFVPPRHEFEGFPRGPRPPNGRPDLYHEEYPPEPFEPDDYELVHGAPGPHGGYGPHEYMSGPYGAPAGRPPPPPAEI